MHQNSIKIVVLRGQLGELISIASRAMLSEAASWGSYFFKLRADHKSPPAHRPVFFSHLPAALPLLTCEALIPPKWLAGFTMVFFFSVCLGACFSWNSTCTGSKGIYCRNDVWDFFPPTRIILGYPVLSSSPRRSCLKVIVKPLCSLQAPKSRFLVLH